MDYVIFGVFIFLVILISSTSYTNYILKEKKKNLIEQYFNNNTNLIGTTISDFKKHNLKKGTFFIEKRFNPFNFKFRKIIEVHGDWVKWIYSDNYEDVVLEKDTVKVASEKLNKGTLWKYYVVKFLYELNNDEIKEIPCKATDVKCESTEKPDDIFYNYVKSKPTISDVKPGNLFLEVRTNPFESKYIGYKVLEIKDEYVKYAFTSVFSDKDLNFKSQVVNTCKIKIFILENNYRKVFLLKPNVDQL